MIQNIAEDDARGATADAWDKARAIFATLADDELTDPDISADRLLYRLFHEDGVRLFEAKPLRAFCRCSEDRVIGMLRTFTAEEMEGMVEADGRIRVTCEYCSRAYEVAPDTVGL